MTKSKQIFDQSTDQLNESLDKIMNLPDSKVMNKDEQKLVMSNIAALTHTLTKASKSGLISPELKDISRNFEKANFDITRMPREYVQSLKRTYEDFSEVIKNNPGAYKGKASKAYCDTYELFNGVKFKAFVNKLRNSRGLKRVIGSKESLDNLTSIEALDNKINEINEKSEEGIGTALVNKILGPVATEFTGLTSSVGMLSSVFIISVIIISILIICLCIISAMYQQKVCEAIEELCRNADDPKYPKKLDKVAVITSMEDNIPRATNTFLVKPMVLTTKYLNKVTDDKNAKNISKGLDILDKASDNSKESYDLSSEGVIPTEFLGHFISFVSKNPIFIAAAVILALVMIVPLVRGLVYWCVHFKFRVGLLLKTQNETINENIEVLIMKMNDPSTSPDEKERLSRVIKRQEGMATTLKKMSDLFYKEQLNANSDTSNELRDDDNKDFDSVVEQINKKVEEAQSNSVEDPNNPTPGSASIIF